MALFTMLDKFNNHVHREKPNTHLAPLTKCNSKLTYDLYIRPKIIKSLEKKQGESLVILDLAAMIF